MWIKCNKPHVPHVNYKIIIMKINELSVKNENQVTWKETHMNCVKAITRKSKWIMWKIRLCVQ